MTSGPDHSRGDLEAFWLTPDFAEDTWAEVLLAYLETFKAGESVALLFVLDPGQGSLPEVADLETLVLQLANQLGLKAFPDVEVIPRPEALLPSLLRYRILHRLPLDGPSQVSDTAALRRLRAALAKKEASAQGPPPPAPRTTWESTICFVGTCYPAFLQHHYQAHPTLVHAPYQVQLEALLGTGFGDADFYSRGMAEAGWQAWDLVANCVPLQEAWAREHGFEGDLTSILVEQIRRLDPDVVYLQDLTLANAPLLARMRPYTRILAGQIASPLLPVTHLPGLDVLVSSFPHFVEQFRKDGLCAFYQPLAFDPKILTHLGARNATIPFSFVGGISAHHTKGTQLLAEVAQGTPLHLWGYGSEHLSSDSPLLGRHHGEAWGMDMFDLLHRSQISLNRHIDTAGRFANNMRLFEATGAGAMLLTDHKDNLADLFRIGEEIVAYRSPEECSHLVRYFLAHPEEAEAIARAGQARTLKDHTYRQRMADSAERFERLLKAPDRRRTYPCPDLGAISSAYQPLSPEHLHAGLTEAWKDHRIATRQRGLVEEQLEKLYQGQTNPVFQVLAELLDAVLLPGDPLLEIGCSSGYYYEILQYLLNRSIAYTGVDYSPNFIAMAKSLYPKARFDQSDGAVLPYGNQVFPVVVSSGILLHTPNYREHIRETTRVAGSYVVAHRTPVCRSGPTQLLKKLAYGVETVELRFNESEFLQAWQDEGMLLDRYIEFGAQPDQDQFEISYRFRRPDAERPELP